MLFLRPHRRRVLVLPSAFPTGLVGWLSPSLETDADAGAMAAITNQVNGSRNIAQSVAGNKPTMRRSNAGLQAQDAVQYTTDDFFLATTESAAWTQNVGGFTVIAAVQLASVPGTTQRLVSFSTTTTTANRFGVFASSTAWSLATRRLDADGATTLSTTAVPDTAPHIIHAMMDYTNGKARIWVDGALAATSDAHGTSGSTSNTASGRVRIGADLSAVAIEYLEGKHGLMAFWSQAYTATDLAAMSRSWCRYYGIAFKGTP